MVRPVKNTACRKPGKRLPAVLASLVIWMAPCAFAKTPPTPSPARPAGSGLPTSTFRRILLGQLPLSPRQIHALK